MIGTRPGIRRTTAGLLLCAALVVLAVAPAGGGATGHAAVAATNDVSGAVSSYTPTDIYLRDNPSDLGYEPSASPFWNSPDIRVCPTVLLCATSVNPVAGSTAYVFVTLRNPGPYGVGTDSGSLRLYYSVAGAGPWPTAWSLLNTSLLTVPPGVTTASLAWSAIPGPGTVNILAVWDSPGDPVLVNTSNPQVNTQYNNNIAWKGVVVI